jgi:exosome complex exonuclease DIS3/RRP44
LRIDGAASGDELAGDLRQLNAFAKRLRATRLEKGALTLASTQVRFVRGAGADMAAEGAITDVALYETRDTNSMVEEFMLLANVSVADHLLRAYPQFALLRRHPEPSDGAFDALSHVINVVLCFFFFFFFFFGFLFTTLVLKIGGECIWHYDQCQ